MKYVTLIINAEVFRVIILLAENTFTPISMTADIESRHSLMNKAVVALIFADYQLSRVVMMNNSLYWE